MHRLKLQTSRRRGQVDPAATTAVGFRVSKTPDRVELENLDEGDVNSRRLIIPKPLPHHALLEDVQWLERAHFFPVGHDLRLLHARKILNLDLVRLRLRQNGAGRQADAVQLLVKKSREKEELPMAKSEAVAPLRDPAFADDDRLAAFTHGLADERPLLETDTLHFAACKTTLPPMPFKIDLHTHSFFSGDGVSSPEENIASARAKGLHGFVLTDHNTNDGVTYLLDKGLMREDGMPVDDFLIIPGVEVTTAEGHLLSIGASLPYLKGRPAREVCDLIHERGGLAIPPHPYDLFRAGIRFSTLEKLPIDAIEVFNAATTLRRYNRYAFKYAQVRGLPMTAASDAHHHAAIGTAYTILDTEDFSVRGILAQIVKSNELNQEYLTPKDSVRKTWNNWMRLRRRKTLPLRPTEVDGA